MWSFETDPELQERLDWADEFVRSEIEPLDLVHWGEQFAPLEGDLKRRVRGLQQQVKDHGWWAVHLTTEMGGRGYGQLTLALLNEILGRSSWAPIVFGCQAPDTGNAELLAHFANDEQKKRYLEPLLANEIVSCFSMTEPQGGADPSVFTTTATKTPDGWVLNGSKYFSSNAKYAGFFIVMAVTNPDVSVHQGSSMFLVEPDAPGVVIEHNAGLGNEPAEVGTHALIRYEDVHLGPEALIGDEGSAFLMAQTRLGGGRIHHAMRTVGQVRKALDMMCERALSRHTAGSRLSEKQFVQGYIADSYAQLEMFRLLVLQTAWKIDKYQDYKKVRKDISAVKATMPTVYHDIVQRAIQVHGALGISNDMPLSSMWVGAMVMGLADGPTEVHKVTVAKQVLRDYSEHPGEWPSEYLPTKRAAARAKLGGT